MPSVVLCNSIDCMFNDDGQCDVDKLAVVDGVCAGSLSCGRNIAGNDLDERLKDENAKLRDLIHDLLRLPTAPAFDCFNCRYEEHDDCDYGHRCKLVERARDLGIEAE